MMTIVSLNIPDDIVEHIDNLRGRVNRSVFVVMMLEAQLKKIQGPHEEAPVQC